jgi:hypothetical protein
VAATGSAVVSTVNAVGVAAATDNVRVEVAEFVDDPASVTFTLNENCPLTVGVPEIIPVAAARDNPDGSLPELTPHTTEDVSPVAAILSL